MGSVGSQSTEITIETVIGEFDVGIAVYEDASFTKVAGNNYEVIVPDHVFIGLVLNNAPNFIIRATRCWVTPNANSNHAHQFTIIENGCKNIYVKYLTS